MLKFIRLVIYLTICAVAAHEDVSNFVVGGRFAKNGQFPYVANFQTFYGNTRGGCGGGILNERWILTAAHCLFDLNLDNVIVRMGNVRRFKGDFYWIEKAIRHPNFIRSIPWVWTSNWDDIGLVKTKSRIIFNKFVQPIPIDTSYISGNVEGVIAGFGADNPNTTIYTPIEDLEMAEDLQYMNARTISHFDCSMRVAALNTLQPMYVLQPIINQRSHLCTLQPRGVGICMGDSGSVLVSNGKVIGVVANGVRLCGQSAFAPDLFTRVSSYIGWINSFINDLS